MKFAARSFLFRLVLTIAALALWFWTQGLLGSRAPRGTGIGDALHIFTSNWNSYLHLHPGAANALLIVSSALIDAFGFFLLLKWLFGKSVRPFLGLVLLLMLRQAMQALCALPPPQGMIWHYPGVPSALVTYSVASDFFFSGHTSIAVFGATEIARLRKPWLTAAAIFVVVFEMAAVIVLRAHYTMDVFTGLIAALWVAAIVERLSIPVDRLLSGPIATK
ncbi:MAG TPA: phosphatase PAP2-related protein [Candidatus Sulfotelmatobacter sp.]|nr:phosphatase PAP2-related protein [Candidatus Sulfotelmatobacter sp.]